MKLILIMIKILNILVDINYWNHLLLILLVKRIMKLIIIIPKKIQKKKKIQISYNNYKKIILNYLK